MNILNAIKQLRDDIKIWVTNNLNALNAKIDEKTIPIDSELSSTSTNPVQNKAIKKAIDNIPTFSGDYNDLTNAPDISEDGSGNMIIADELGNIIFKADAEGIHTTAVSLNGEAAATEKYVDAAVANIPTPDVSGQINAHNTSEEAHADIRQAIEDAKEELSESIVAESDDWKVVDEAGNIIFSVDATGAHTTSMTLGGKNAATEEYVDNAISNIPSTDLTNYATKNYVDNAISNIPSVDLTGYATTSYVDDAIASISIPEVDFTGYATETYVNNTISSTMSNYYNKQETSSAIEDAKRDLSESIVAEEDEWKVVDESGNIIFSVDAEGAHTTNLSLDGEYVATEKYVDDAIAAVDAKISNVAAVAEGKTNSYVLSYNETIETLKEKLKTSTEHKVYDADGNDITAGVKNGDYDSYRIVNNIFSSDSEIVYEVNGYFITFNNIEGTHEGEPYGTSYVILPLPHIAEKFKTGDILYITEVDVPDRWYAGGATPAMFYKMETAKVDLANYYTKSEVDALIESKISQYLTSIEADDVEFGS